MALSRSFFKQALVQNLPLWEFIKKSGASESSNFADTLKALDFIHIATGLLSAYSKDYPLVEARELIPSFDAPLIEYKKLPAFSMVILDRSISYQDEGFQFDQLSHEGSPPDQRLVTMNRQLLRDRLPRDQIQDMEKSLGRKAITPFERYPHILPHLIKMDRGHVIAKDGGNSQRLYGVFASFPSDLDGEIKRFGRQIGKFKKGDNKIYAANRHFVYHFLMEQGGFPICGERHTSAALFARRLMRRRECFAVRVLGASDRTITNLTSLDAKKRLPRVVKTSLISGSGLSEKNQAFLNERGFFIDKRRKALILKVRYMQHSYHQDNVLEDRALSVASQEVIHPQTGETLQMDVLGISQDRLFMLNDIVRGEFEGSIVYRGRESVTDTHEVDNRLKFLTAWLRKHRFILADYSPDNFERARKLLSSFLENPDNKEPFSRHESLLSDVKAELADLRVAHRLRLLEKLVNERRDASGRRLQLVHVLIILVHFLGQEGNDLARNHPQALLKLLRLCRKQLESSYLIRRYLSKPPESAKDREVVGEYKLLSRLVERFAAQLEH